MKAAVSKQLWLLLIHFTYMYATLALNTLNQHHVGAAMKTYSDAAIECSARGMELITAKTKQEMDALDKLISDNNISGGVWLGLTLGLHTNNPADFVWNDITPMSWTKWGTRYPEPNYLDTDKCVASLTSDNNEWFTRSCRLEYYYICQKLAKSSNGSQSVTVSLYMTECPSLKPQGPILRQTLTSSRMTCAGDCLQQPGCDVLYHHDSGICQLFNKQDINLTLHDKSAEGWVTYKKQ